jgi:hypothetical protein
MYRYKNSLTRQSEGPVRIYAGLLKKHDYTCYKNTDTSYSQHTIINMDGSWHIDDMQNVRDFSSMSASDNGH